MVSAISAVGGPDGKVEVETTEKDLATYIMDIANQDNYFLP